VGQKKISTLTTGSVPLERPETAFVAERVGLLPEPARDASL